MYGDPHGDPHGYGYGVGMGIEIPSPRQPCLFVNERSNTRGNNYKLQNHSFHYDLRKHFFLCTPCKYLEQLA